MANNNNSVGQTNATATPSVRVSNTTNGTVRYFEDYCVTTSSVSATGDTVSFLASAIPVGAKIISNGIEVYSGAFGTGVVVNLGDSGSATRYLSSGDVSAATALYKSGANSPGGTAATYGGLKATGGGDYTVTADGYQIIATFKVSAPATGIGIGIRVPYVF